MIMAGMQSIPDEVYQAAAVDGAGVWKQLRYITLGILRPVNGGLVLMLFLWTFHRPHPPFLPRLPPPASARLCPPPLPVVLRPAAPCQVPVAPDIAG